ncbi:MAG TPA: S1 RNA-binding domain-containing protein [Firmicutes bacterium]|nr:S1 RNA-binding domain-containing protein [Bacillota bacterium]
MAIEVGSIIEGVVTGITHFGAFVMLPDGKTGLVHISEVADAYVKDIKDYVKENDRVMVKVLSMDEKGKVGLSIKQARPDYVPRPRDVRKNRNSFEEKLARFMKESDERLQDLRKSAESKRGGRGSSRRNEMAWD